MRVCTGMEAQLLATRGGVMGGLLALSALERSSLRRIALQALPCQGGFVGLYHGEALGTCTTVHGMRVHVVLTMYPLTALPGCSGCAAELECASPAESGAMCNRAVHSCTQGGRLHSFICRCVFVQGSRALRAMPAWC